MIKLYFLGILLLHLILTVNAKFCANKVDCFGYFDCNNGLCTCAPGKVPSQNGINCIDIALGIGAECVEDIQCLSWITGPSVCTKDGLCGCKPGYRYYNNTCTKVSGYNGLCSSDYDCYDGINSNALKCDEGICKCNDAADYYLRGGFDCRISGQGTNKCFFNIDCPDDKCCAFKYGPTGDCVNNIVTNECFELALNDAIYHKKYDELIFSDKYTSISNLHLNCNKNEDCSEVANSICPEFRKECTCKDGFVYQQSSNSCVPVLGSSCSDDEDCLIKYSFCNANKICTCSDYFINSNYNEKCFKPARDIGTSCARDESCYSLGIYAICSNNKCECGDNTKLDKKFMLCRPQNDSCDADCSYKLHSTCINNKCVCDEHYLDNGFKCLPDIGYGCSNVNADCIIDNAHCFNNKCECSSRYEQDSNRSCKKKNECLDDCKTKPHSFCHQLTYCKCEENYFDYGNECLPDLGYECDMEVNLCKIPNAECINHKCECIEGYVKEDKRKCRKEETGGKPCTTIIQIYTNNNFTIVN